LKTYDIGCVFHHIPLHSAPAGLSYAKFNGADQHTTKESERLIRLPIYFGVTSEEQAQVIKAVVEFFA